MQDQETPGNLTVEVSSSLAEVGDRTTVSGEAKAEMGHSYDLRFAPGESLSWEFELRRIAGCVSAVGRIRGFLEMNCSRCLRKFSHPLDLEMREHVLWLEPGEEAHGAEETGEYTVISGQLELIDLIRDAVCLAVPGMRVCDEACKGICPVCGVDLNAESCTCVTKRADSRLETG